jgi:hypothetical protein
MCRPETNNRFIPGANSEGGQKMRTIEELMAISQSITKSFDELGLTQVEGMFVIAILQNYINYSVAKGFFIEKE